MPWPSTLATRQKHQESHLKILLPEPHPRPVKLESQVKGPWHCFFVVCFWFCMFYLVLISPGGFNVKSGLRNRWPNDISDPKSFKTKPN